MPRITIVLEWEESENVPPADGGWWSPSVYDYGTEEGVTGNLPLRFVTELAGVAAMAAIAAATPTAESGGYPPDLCDLLDEQMRGHTIAWRRYHAPEANESEGIK